jgi:hypothetical protein
MNITENVTKLSTRLWVGKEYYQMQLMRILNKKQYKGKKSDRMPPDCAL